MRKRSPQREDAGAKMSAHCSVQTADESGEGKRHRKTSRMLYDADFKECLEQEERVGHQGSVV